MRVHVKIKFGADKNSIESFGNGRYLVYMKMPGEDPSAMDFFISLFSKFTGAEPKHIKYIGKIGEEQIFEI